MVWQYRQYMEVRAAVQAVRCVRHHTAQYALRSAQSNVTTKKKSNVQSEQTDAAANTYSMLPIYLFSQSIYHVHLPGLAFSRLVCKALADPHHANLRPQTHTDSHAQIRTAQDTRQCESSKVKAPPKSVIEGTTVAVTTRT